MDCKLVVLRKSPLSGIEKLVKNLLAPPRVATCGYLDSKICDLGVSRQFAFVHFYSVPGARAFLEQHYPTLNLGQGAERCRIAFSRERENDDRRGGRRRDEGEEEWKCRVVSIPYPGCPGLRFGLSSYDGRLFAVYIFADSAFASVFF